MIAFDINSRCIEGKLLIVACALLMEGCLEFKDKESDIVLSTLVKTMEAMEN